MQNQQAEKLGWLVHPRNELWLRLMIALPPELTLLLAPPFDMGVLVISEVGSHRWEVLHSTCTNSPNDNRWEAFYSQIVSQANGGETFLGKTDPSDFLIPSASALPSLDPTGAHGRISSSQRNSTHLPSWKKQQISMLDLNSLLPEIRSQAEAECLKAGLWLLQDELEQSHRISQKYEGYGKHRIGDHWHGMMHRREPDYSNAKYWYRRVGDSVIFPALRQFAFELFEAIDHPEKESWQGELGLHSDAALDWNSFGVIDFCRHCNKSKDPILTEVAQWIQWTEMLLLFQQTYQDATGK